MLATIWVKNHLDCLRNPQQMMLWSKKTLNSNPWKMWSLRRLLSGLRHSTLRSKSSWKKKRLRMMRFTSSSTARMKQRKTLTQRILLKRVKCGETFPRVPHQQGASAQKRNLWSGLQALPGGLISRGLRACIPKQNRKSKIWPWKTTARNQQI